MRIGTFVIGRSRRCPFCNSRQIDRWSGKGMIRRYYCRECKKYFRGWIFPFPLLRISAP